MMAPIPRPTRTLAMAALVVVLLAVAGAVARKPLQGVFADAPAGCPAVLLLGARGSGETDAGKAAVGSVPSPVFHGLGPEVNSFFTDLKADLPQAAPPKSLLAVFPAAPVTTLYPSKTEIAAYATALASGIFAPGAAAAYNRDHLTPFLASLNEGVNATIDELTTEKGQCPDVRFVLAGYSQGAMAMHQALLRLVDARRADILDRIVATVLIADGDRKSGTAATRFGTAPISGEGVRSALTVGERDVPSAKASSTYDICNAGDLVCDFSPRLLADVGAASNVHTSAYTGSTMLSAVARLVAGSITGAAPPAPATPTPAPHDCILFAGDVTVPDGTAEPAGAMFTKSWRLRNCGTTHWGKLTAVRVEGRIGPPSFAIPVTAPGTSAVVGAAFIAPGAAGEARSTYQVQDAAGHAVGSRFWVRITVAAAPPTTVAVQSATVDVPPTTVAVPPPVVAAPPVVPDEGPPATDPGQDDPPAGARHLGPVDLDRYCGRGWGMHAVIRYPVAWGWRCSASPVAAAGLRQGDQDVSVDDACAQQYSAGARSHYRSYSDPNSWFCWAPAG
jgi:Ig-like domain from next to BRCA1 gene/Cutinase